MIGAHLSVRLFRAEGFDGFALGHGGEGEEGKIAVPSVRKHDLRQLVVTVDFVLFPALQLGIFPQRILGIGKGGLHFDGGGACLRGMCFVYNNGKTLAGRVADFLVNDGEFLQCGDDNAAAVMNGLQQVFGIFAFADGFDHAERVVKIRHRFLQLLVKHGAIGHDNHGIEDRLILVIVQRGKAIGCPRDGIGLAGACRVLNEIILSRTA